MKERRWKGFDGGVKTVKKKEEGESLDFYFVYLFGGILVEEEKDEEEEESLAHKEATNVGVVWDEVDVKETALWCIDGQSSQRRRRWGVQERRRRTWE